MMKRLALALLILIGFFSVGIPAFAQNATDVSVTLSPENPGPNQSVTISLVSYSVDIESADIEWTKDNQSPTGGVGATTYTFTTKALGVPTNITVTIDPVGSARITKTITVKPMSVDVLWQATDSTVPPFYRGKAMPTSESEVKFVAIPDVQSTSGALIAGKSLVYDWSENYTADAADSGYGKDSYTSAMDYLNPTKHIDVDVSTVTGGVVASSSIDVSPVDPQVLWYASSPLYGPIFDLALSGSYNVSGTDTSVYAEPYFFSPGNPTAADLTYTWTINSQPINTPATPNSIFLQKDASSNGAAEIDLEVKNSTKLFQDITSNLNLHLD